VVAKCSNILQDNLFDTKLQGRTFSQKRNKQNWLNIGISNFSIEYSIFKNVYQSSFIVKVFSYFLIFQTLKVKFTLFLSSVPDEDY
jgi:hypothetical protein